VSDVFVEEAAEGPEALKTDFKANVCNSQFIGAQQFLCFLDTPFNQILVWGFVESLPEKTEKVVTGKAGLLGDLVQIKRMVVTVIDKLPSPPQTLESFQVRLVFCFSVDLSNDHFGNVYDE